MHTAALTWGPTGVREAIARNDLVVVVDVLRFSSTVTTAVANGFTIIPLSDPRKAERLSIDTGMPVSGKTGVARYSLSPLDYVNPKQVEELILVSSNGGACVEEIPGGGTGFIGCFLNARTLGRVMRGISEREGRNVTVVAAGEVPEDQADGPLALRFAIEDYLACGLIFFELKLGLTADATLCMRAYESSKMDYLDLIKRSESGRYLITRGHEYDISHCVQRSIYEIVPVISEGRIGMYRGS
jgi:2-phosphosulfolactate phosphatase